MLLDISETAKVPSAVAQSQNSESLCAAPYFSHEILLLEAVGTAPFKSAGFSPLSWSA